VHPQFELRFKRSGRLDLGAAECGAARAFFGRGQLQRRAGDRGCPVQLQTGGTGEGRIADHRGDLRAVELHDRGGGLAGDVHVEAVGTHGQPPWAIEPDQFGRPFAAAAGVRGYTFVRFWQLREGSRFQAFERRYGSFAKARDVQLLAVGTDRHAERIGNGLHLGAVFRFTGMRGRYAAQLGEVTRFRVAVELDHRTVVVGVGVDVLAVRADDEILRTVDCSSVSACLVEAAYAARFLRKLRERTRLRFTFKSDDRAFAIFTAGGDVDILLVGAHDDPDGSFEPYRNRRAAFAHCDAADAVVRCSQLFNRARFAVSGELRHGTVRVARHIHAFPVRADRDPVGLVEALRPLCFAFRPGRFAGDASDFRQQAGFWVAAERRQVVCAAALADHIHAVAFRAYRERRRLVDRGHVHGRVFRCARRMAARLRRYAADHRERTARRVATVLDQVACRRD